MIEAILIAVLVSLIWWATAAFGMPKAYGPQPVLKKSRQPPRFALRTLLVAMTLIAVALGILAAIDAF